MCVCFADGNLTQSDTVVAEIGGVLLADGYTYWLVERSLSKSKKYILETWFFGLSCFMYIILHLVLLLLPPPFLFVYHQTRFCLILYSWMQGLCLLTLNREEINRRVYKTRSRWILSTRNHCIWLYPVAWENNIYCAWCFIAVYSVYLFLVKRIVCLYVV